MLVSYNSIITPSKSSLSLVLFKVGPSSPELSTPLVPPLRAKGRSKMMPTDFKAISFSRWKFLLLILNRFTEWNLTSFYSAHARQCAQVIQDEIQVVCRKYETLTIACPSYCEKWKCLKICHSLERVALTDALGFSAHCKIIKVMDSCLDYIVSI